MIKLLIKMPDQVGVTVQMIPKDILSLIPKFDGDKNILNLFIKKSEYILRNFNGPNNAVQTTYNFHAITSRLCGRAAALLSEREDISTWDQLKSIFIQHFGDPRSEDCVAIELENLKIKSNETYLEFCNRIQQIRSTLISKVNLLANEEMKAAKMVIYNNLSLNVFLYNLPEDLIRIVRLKSCTSLESALSVVMEEVNFQFQYNAKNKSNTKTAQPPPNTNLQGFKFQPPMKPNVLAANNFGYPVNQNFKFGVPHPPQNNFRSGFNNNYRFGVPNQTYPKPGMQQPQGYTPVYTSGGPPNQNNFKFGIGPQQGFRPQLNNAQNRPNLNPPNQQFKFGIPPRYQPQRNLPQPQDADVSMRTVRPLRNNMITNNSDDENTLHLYNNNNETHVVQDLDFQPDYVNCANNVHLTDSYEHTAYDNNFYFENVEPISNETTNQEEYVNFPIIASVNDHPK